MRARAAQAEEWAGALRRLTTAHAEARRAAAEAIARCGALTDRAAEAEE